MVYEKRTYVGYEKNDLRMCYMLYPRGEGVNFARSDHPSECTVFIGFQVELVEAYCDPRDSRQNRLSSEIDESFYQTHPSPPEPAPSHPPLREYSQPYTTGK